MNTLKGYAILAALVVPGLALAASESELNSPIGMANTLTISAEGSSTVDGIIGVNSGVAIVDLDFYTFSGKGGDVVTIDIDGGMGGVRSVDTILAIFGPAPTYQVLRQSDDEALDEGSMRKPPPGDPNTTSDARIIDFVLPTTGTYTVGVSSYKRLFVTGGGTVDTKLRANPNGDYTLLITGVTPPLQLISIDIKPGNDSLAPINPRSRGKIPVALLGSSDFVVADVNTSTLTFGHSGNEESLAKCHDAADVNGDAFPDLLCHFENQDAKFAESDLEAILRGELQNGTQFEGRGWLKVVPVKAE